MELSTDSLRDLAVRLGAAAQNALEVVRFGGLETGEEPSPYEVVAHHKTYRLRHYFPDAGPIDGVVRPPVVLVPPLMLATEVYDVSPLTSAVATLHANGLDPWVVDFGAPEHEQGGLDRNLTDHVLAVDDAVSRVFTATGREVHLAGYSQGGMFCYQTAAYRRRPGIASLITFGSPVDTSQLIPFGLPEEAVTRLLTSIADSALSRISLPAWVTRNGFQMLDPAKTLRSRIDFVRQLHDREALLPREGQRRFLEGEGWVAWSGPALAELLRQFVAHNRMVQGGFEIGPRLVTLADIAQPMMCVVGEVDEIAPPAAVRAIRVASPKPEIWERTLRAGHFGLVVGGLATSVSWPLVADWVRWREGVGARPVDLHPLAVSTPGEDDAGTLARAVHLAELASGVGISAARGAADAVTRTGRIARALVVEAIDQLPRLSRIEGAGPATRVSLGSLLDEQAATNGHTTFFLFEGRGHTYGDAKRRIDNIVRGLLSVGIRQGEHVGVLMDTRPSAIAVVSALSRLGAVVVLLRPDGDTTREAELGQISRLIADPEHAASATKAAEEAGGSFSVLVLGGGGEPRELGFGLTDMERIDPDAVTIPAWYSPNPGRGRDLAFITFTGAGDTTRSNRITNRRWALSAFGTASAAALTPADTVYGITPIHHPSGLLTSIGGAIAGGARLALTSQHSTQTFWSEVRRYGVTVVSYTWTSARSVVDGPADPFEKGHPIRLFMGSGMPSGLWRRTLERFAPANVLEFYASTEGEAILVNLRGRKVGSKGRPLPGSAKVRIAAYDLEANRLITGPDGFAISCSKGELGMLLARAEHDRGGLIGSPLRGVFARGDAWEVTGDLMRRDDDGDFTLVDHLSSFVRTAAGPIAPSPVEDALSSLATVDLAVAYGVSDGHGADLLVAAVSLRRGVEALDPASLSGVFLGLSERELPSVVRVVPSIPTTTWFRPSRGVLRREGIPVPSAVEGVGPSFVLDPKKGTWVPLTAARRKRLLSG